MKLFFTFLLAFAAAATAQAGVITAVANNGNWGSNSTWDLNRTPQNGDTIVIPSNITVLFNADQNLNGVLIKVYGTLSMTGGRKLNLDTASVIKVYPGGKIMGSGASDQIRLGTNHIFSGNSPAIVGPMYADVTTGSGFSPMSVMPVVFISFYLSKENNGIKISWSTASEVNNDHFEILRSYDGINFVSITTVPGKGNTSSISYYSFTDTKMSSPTAYYRIKQVDVNGTYSLTAISSIKNSEENNIAEIFATSNRNITVKFNSVQTAVSVRVINMNGQAVSQQSFNQANYIAFQLNNVGPGVYVVQVIDKNNNAQSKKILLQ